jgi:hypothetical protein
MRRRANLLTDDRSFEYIGAVRQVQVVRLRRAEWQYSHFVLVFFDLTEIRFQKYPWAHDWNDPVGLAS